MYGGFSNPPMLCQSKTLGRLENLPYMRSKLLPLAINDE